MINLLKKAKYKLLGWRAKQKKAVPVESENLPMVICCVFKNEAPYLKEWIDFHLNQGFQKFYLIDNRSEDGYHKVLKPYLYDGSVRLLSSVNNHMNTIIQACEFNAAIPWIRREVGEQAWVAFIDVDEYLFSVEDVSVTGVLNSFAGKKVAAVLANWLMFGTSNKYILEDDQPLIGQLTKRAPGEHDEHRLFKPITFLPNVFRFFEGPHRPIVVGDSQFYYSDESKYQADSPKHIHSPLRINHYWYRSEQYYKEHKLGKRKSFGDIREKKLENWHREKCNEVEDREILKQRK